MILKSETYHFHRLDLTRQAGFIVTIYDEDGLRLAATMPFSTPAEAFGGSAKDRGQQSRGTQKIIFGRRLASKPPEPHARVSRGLRHNSA